MRSAAWHSVGHLCCPNSDLRAQGDLDGVTRDQLRILVGRNPFAASRSLAVDDQLWGGSFAPGELRLQKTGIGELLVDGLESGPDLGQPHVRVLELPVEIRPPLVLQFLQSSAQFLTVLLDLAEPLCALQVLS